MAEDTKIQWCDHTFNPFRGCSKVHEGCANCYAEVNYSNKMHGVKWGPNGTRVRLSDAGWREPLKWNRAAEKSGVRARVFCASLADVFEDWRGPILSHRGKPIHHGKPWGTKEKYVERDERIGKSLITMDDLRRDLFELIDATPYLDWLLLTKRPDNIRRMIVPHCLESVPGHVRQNEGDGKVIRRRENIWLGTSISLQEHADKQVPELLKCRDLSPCLFVSAEPLLGTLDLTSYLPCAACSFGNCYEHPIGNQGPNRATLDWVIVGGESGPKSRRCDVQWIRDLRDQCTAAGVPVLIKQLGAHVTWNGVQGGYMNGTPNVWPEGMRREDTGQGHFRVYLKDAKGGDMAEWPEDMRVRQFPEPISA